MTAVPKANHACGISGEGADRDFSVQQGASAQPDVSVQPCISVRLDEVAVGTIRCESWNTWTLAYQISILRANRQIYCEARGIFHLENFWILVQVNKAGFGKEMKNRGFPVATAVDLWHHIRFPVMKVTVLFLSLESQKQSEALLVAAVHSDRLIRTLWTVKGLSEMEVMIDIQPRHTNNSPDKCYLLRPFERLHNVKRVTILGASDQKNIDELTRSMTTYGINYTLPELLAGTKCLQRCIHEKLWESAIAQAKEQIVFITDCKVVYGKRFTKIEALDPGITMKTAIVHTQSVKEMIIANAIGIAEITLFLRQYENTVRFADRALDLISHASTAQPGTLPVTNFVLRLHYPFPSITGTVTFDGRSTSRVLRIRARAYMGMGQLERAFRDSKKARELLPKHPTPPSVLENLQLRYGRFPSIPPPHPTFESSAFAVNFARAADVMAFD